MTDMQTRFVDITDIEQGTIDDYGNQNSSTRVRSVGRYAVNLGQQIKISAESNSNIKTNIMLYADSTTNRALWDSGWFDNGASIDVSNYPTAKYFRVVLRKSDGADITPLDIISCQAEVTDTEIDYIWHVKDGELICDNFYISANPEMVKPYPKAYFQIDETENLTSGLIPDLTHVEGRPLFQWYIDEECGVVSGGLMTANLMGAFANATNLSEVVIPKTCKKIGRYSFRNTKLTSVTIARDCEYYPTSFPDGCVVNFYPD